MKLRIENIAIHFLVIILAIIGVSCASTKPLYIEVPEKGKNELPADIQSLLLISRSVDNSFNDLKEDSLQRIFYLKQFDSDTIINDIQSVDTTLKALGDLLYESGRYDIVIPENRFLRGADNSLAGVQMPFNEAKQLCDTFKTNAVLSIDFFKTKVITNYDRENYFNQLENSFFAISRAKMKVYYEALFRVYDPVKEKVIFRKFVRDTLFWETSDKSPEAVFSRFTPVKSALSEAGISMALAISNEISSVYHYEKRSFFASGDENLKAAAPLVYNNQWEPAIGLWEKSVENSKSKSVKSKAEFNIALAYEMLGDLDKSINWALKSYETMFRINTYEYLELLQIKKSESQIKKP